MMDKVFLKYMNPEHPEIINNLPPTIFITSRGDFLNHYSIMMNEAMKKASDAEKKKKACEDIWMASRGFALASGEEDRLRLWCDAFYDELMEYYPFGKSYYQELEDNFRK